jgi:polyadenylate-binding protein 2
LGFVQLQELDEMKRRLKEMEEEAAALRDMQAKVAKEMQGGDPSASTAEAKEQVDARSVYVGNVRFNKLSFSLSLLWVYVPVF